jgi:predicted PurR-regulated permease PerM
MGDIMTISALAGQPAPNEMRVDVGRLDVKLHPLTIVLGVAGGAMRRGPAGMFVAVPSIAVVKVFASSTVKHLSASGVV